VGERNEAIKTTKHSRRRRKKRAKKKKRREAIGATAHLLAAAASAFLLSVALALRSNVSFEHVKSNKEATKRTSVSKQIDSAHAQRPGEQRAEHSDSAASIDSRNAQKVQV
jgi:hypothetical protein